MPEDIQAPENPYNPLWTKRDIFRGLFHAAGILLCGAGQIVLMQSMWRPGLLTNAAASGIAFIAAEAAILWDIKRQSPFVPGENIQSVLNKLSQKAGLKEIPEMRLSPPGEGWATRVSLFNRKPRIRGGRRRLRKDIADMSARDSIGHEIAHIKLKHFQTRQLILAVLLVGNLLAYKFPFLPVVNDFSLNNLNNLKNLTGEQAVSDLFNLAVAAVAFYGLQKVIRWLITDQNRANELQAARYGTQLAGTREYLIGQYRKSAQRQTLREALKENLLEDHPSYGRYVKELERSNRMEARMAAKQKMEELVK